MLKKNLSLVIALAIVMSFAIVALAQGGKQTMVGYVVDKACSARVSKKENVQEAASAHTKGCALMEGCAKSGYGVFVDGKYYEFDDKGTEMAKAAIEKTSKTTGLKFKVVGTMKDGKVAVESITEAE